MNALVMQIAKVTWKKLAKELAIVAVVSVVHSAGEALGHTVIKKIFNEEEPDIETFKAKVVKTVDAYLEHKETEEAKAVQDDTDLVQFIEGVIGSFIEREYPDPEPQPEPTPEPEPKKKAKKKKKKKK